MSNLWPKVQLGKLLERSKQTVAIHPGTAYREVTVRLWGNGVVERAKAPSIALNGGRRFVARQEQFIVSRIDA